MGGLAHKLPPCSLARPRRRELAGAAYRNFSGRQNAFFVQCDTPAPLVSPGRDGDGGVVHRADAGRATLEWTKNVPTRAVAALDARLPTPGPPFLQPLRAAEAERRRTSRAANGGEGYGRQAAGAVIFTRARRRRLLHPPPRRAPPRQDGDRMMHVDGGLAGTSAAANVARLGATELPMIAVWANTDEAPTATAGRKPAVHYMTQGDGGSGASCSADRGERRRARRCSRRRTTTRRAGPRRGMSRCVFAFS